MNYFEHNAKATSWDVVDLEPIQVTESELTNEQVEEFRQWITTRNDFSSAQSLPRLQALRFG